MKISIKCNANEVKASIEGVIGRMKSLRKPLSDAARHFKTSVRENFDKGGRFSSAGSIEGGSSNWNGLKYPRLTASGKKSSNQRPLLKSGLLRRSIYSRVVGNGIEMGSPLEYAAIHNFGGKTRPHEIKAKHGKALKFFPGGAGSKAVFRSTSKKPFKHPGSLIPARPFLVLQPSDLEYFKQRLLSHIIGC